MIDIQLSGFNELFKKISTLPADILEEVDEEMSDAANLWVGLAKKTSPTDTGRLRGSINARKMPVPHSFEVFAQTNYAAYQEWGTIEYVSVPPELQEIAAKYKGRGIRKRGGVKPRNYFYSQRAIVFPVLKERIEAAVKRML